MAIRSRANATGRGTRRRSGPLGEEQWWDPVDQAAAELAPLTRRDVPRGWRPAPMLNNLERLDPWEGVDAAQALRAARSARRLSALDEGTAWRDRDLRLVVVRVELFADSDADGSAGSDGSDGSDGDGVADARVRHHQDVWRADAIPCLEGAWRARWAERDHAGSWIEARRVELPDNNTLPATAVPVDHYEIEDHSDPSGTGAVTMYQHLTIWAGRAHVVVTARHPLGSDIGELHRMVDAVASRAATRVPVRRSPHSP